MVSEALPQTMAMTADEADDDAFPNIASYDGTITEPFHFTRSGNRGDLSVAVKLGEIANLVVEEGASYTPAISERNEFYFYAPKGKSNTRKDGDFVNVVVPKWCEILGVKETELTTEVVVGKRVHLEWSVFESPQRVTYAIERGDDGKALRGSDGGVVRIIDPQTHKPKTEKAQFRGMLQTKLIGEGKTATVSDADARAAAAELWTQAGGDAQKFRQLAAAHPAVQASVGLKREIATGKYAPAA